MYAENELNAKMAEPKISVETKLHELKESLTIYKEKKHLQFNTQLSTIQMHDMCVKRNGTRLV